MYFDNISLMYVVGVLIIIFIIYYLTMKKETLENTDATAIPSNKIQKIKPWKNCVPWDEAEAGKHDDFCQNDLGEGWKHTGRFKGGCGADEGKGICSKVSI